MSPLTLFIMVVAFCGPLTLQPLTLAHANPIPTLEAVSKQRVQPIIPSHKPLLLPAKPLRVMRNGLVTLGQQYDISHVKNKPNPTKRKKPYQGWGKKDFGNRITSKSVVIMDAKNGQLLFSKSPRLERQPASTIKVLTGLIAIKALRNAELIKVSHRAARMPRSKIYLNHQKKYRANDLINAVLLASANDASVALAEKIAGSEKKFAKIMTHRANLWGAKRTVCQTATGLTAKGQRSTALDLALIFKQAMQDKEFARRMHKTKVKTSYGQSLYNHNKALWQVAGAMAGKTGYTNAARQTYVGQFKRGKDTIIVSIMGSETMWKDVGTLVKHGFKTIKRQRLSQIQPSPTYQQLARLDLK